MRLAIPLRRRALMLPPARILLANDDALVRSGLRMILDAKPDPQVVAEAADGHEALDGTRRRSTTLRF